MPESDPESENKSLKNRLAKAEKARDRATRSLEGLTQENAGLKKEIEKHHLDAADIKKAEDLRNLQAIYEDLEKIEQWTKSVDFLSTTLSFEIRYGYVYYLFTWPVLEAKPREDAINEVVVGRARALATACEEALAKQGQLKAIRERLAPLESVVKAAHDVMQKAQAEE